MKSMNVAEIGGNDEAAFGSCNTIGFSFDWGLPK
jgi:hypothetical protein